MRMESYNLAGHHVRITWNALPTRTPHNEQTIFRGEVSHKDETGLWLLGSFFVEKAETMTVREVPRDKNPESRLYFAPWSSIEVIQIIDEDSKDFEVHQRVMARREGALKNPGAQSR